jgi:hypothetical protein
MRQRLISLFFVLQLGISPCVAAIDAMTGATYMGRTADDLEAWQRIEFRPTRASLRRAPQIKIAIETKGPSMQGLVRIPGGLASNFDTGQGLTMVDLINPGDETRGYAEIVALEIAFTQSVPGQVFRIFAAED